MEKNILVIDDGYEFRELEYLKSVLEETANQNSPVSVTINTKLIDPSPYIDFDAQDPGNKLVDLFNHIDNEVLNNSLDMFLCDFNLHESHKDIAFHIIRYVREKNNSCTIILYSGLPLKQLVTVNFEDFANDISKHIKTENKSAAPGKIKKVLKKLTNTVLASEELLRIAVESRITAIVQRNKMEDTAMEHIVKPSILLRLENELMRYGDMKFNDGNPKLDGLKLGEVARYIREDSELGRQFINEIFELTIAHLVQLNNE
ncbi:MAG: hypothetical protein GY749_33750 [Desulfobacteraceae bacterium]|nr:hypothetical protein [Desulfobacteraceae bacterium]